MQRVRLLLVPVAALAALLVLAAPASANKFTLGVSAGDVTQSSAILWAHTQGQSKVGLILQKGKKAQKCPQADVLPKPRTQAKKSRDNTVHLTVKKLKAATKYAYRFCLPGGKSSAVGKFDTAPKPNQGKTIKFALSGDQDAQVAPGQKTPYWDGFGANHFQVLADMQKENNNFNVEMGDTIYSDTEVPGGPGPQLTKQQKWALYRMNLAQKNWPNLRGATSYYGHWDDHEFLNDFAPGETTLSSQGKPTPVDPTALYNAGKGAFLDYSPTPYNSSTGLYRTVKWGKNLQIFFLDERSFRSNEVNYTDVCKNPQSGSSDLFPTMPQSRRNQLAIFSSALAQPVSPACLAAINDPSRTMLGAAQLAKFEADVKASTAKWKVIFNEVPIQQFYASPYDRWEGYEAERQALVNFLKANVKNSVFLTTDVHANLANTIKFDTIGSNPVDSGIMDITTGSVETENYAREVDSVQAGGSSLLYTQLLKPQPPMGVGMPCAAMDQYSYAEVKVTGSTLTVTPKNVSRQPVLQTKGTANPPYPQTPTNGDGTCAPIVLNAQ